MDFWCEPSSERVYKHTRKQKHDCARLSLHTGKEMFVSGQLLVREVEGDFEVTDIYVQDLPEGVSAELCVQGYATFNDGLPYPDIQQPGKSAHVPANTTQGFWLHLWISDSAFAGAYTLLCTLSTTRGDLTAHVDLQIYPVTLPAPADSAFGHEYFFCATPFFAPAPGWNRKPPITPFYPCFRYSDEWWELMANFARTMKILRVNSLNIAIIDFLVDAGSKRTGEKTWEFDFSLLDRFIEHFLEHGSFRYLTVGAVIASVNGDTVVAVDEQSRHIWYKTSEPDAEYWLCALWGSIYEHFKQKGWLHMLQLRLEDEPHTSDIWLWAKDICDRVCPGVPCGEPLDTHAIAKQLSGRCNQYVPRLEVYAEGSDFYRERQAAGDTVWCYSCCFPEENWWLNKFIDLPHSYSRLINWACFSQGITGFLHWGFNYWGDTTIYGIQPAARYKGDGYIVYPDVEHNGVWLSNRAVATREGLYDWELLHLLEQKDPQAARAISLSVARRFDEFTDDSTLLDAARIRLLQAVSH